MLNRSASLAMSKPCLVNLISKDTHLVFSINGPANESLVLMGLDETKSDFKSGK